MEQDFAELFRDDELDYEKNGALKMFTHIKDNQLFYKTYFKLGYDAKNQITIYDVRRAEKDFDNQHLKYHIEFFRNGINAMIKLWLEGGCEESPQEMVEILKHEYRGR